MFYVGPFLFVLQGDNGTSTAFGDIICFLGALMYGLYTTLIRKYIPDDETVSMSLFFGCLGLFNAILLLPLLLVVEFTLEDLSGLSWHVSLDALALSYVILFSCSLLWCYLHRCWE